MAQDYDVLIIGSGASGGMVARTLTQKGIKCLMLDAGPPVDFERQRTLKSVYELPYRGFGRPGGSLTLRKPANSTPTYGPTKSSIPTPTIPPILTTGCASVWWAERR